MSDFSIESGPSTRHETLPGPTGQEMPNAIALDGPFFIGEPLTQPPVDLDDFHRQVFERNLSRGPTTVAHAILRFTGYAPTQHVVDSSRPIFERGISKPPETTGEQKLYARAGQFVGMDQFVRESINKAYDQLQKILDTDADDHELLMALYDDTANFEAKDPLKSAVGLRDANRGDQNITDAERLIRILMADEKHRINEGISWLAYAQDHAA